MSQTNKSNRNTRKRNGRHQQNRPATKATVFVGGLPQDSSEVSLTSIFSQFGSILKIVLPHKKGTTKLKGFCFITFSTEKAASLAVSQGSLLVFGKLVSVKSALN